MGNITFLFSNGEEKILNFGADSNSSMTKNFVFNIVENYNENKWELRGTLETPEIDVYVNNIIDTLKNNSIESIKINMNDILYEYTLENINQISYNVFDIKGKNIINNDYTTYLFTITLK